MERRKQARRKWKPFTYVNGVSVYLETRARTGAADDPSFMTSHIIRAPPELCKDEACRPRPAAHSPTPRA